MSLRVPNWAHRGSAVPVESLNQLLAVIDVTAAKQPTPKVSLVRQRHRGVSATQRSRWTSSD
jgi:hypothetical protein